MGTTREPERPVDPVTPVPPVTPVSPVRPALTNAVRHVATAAVSNARFKSVKESLSKCGKDTHARY